MARRTQHYRPRRKKSAPPEPVQNKVSEGTRLRGIVVDAAAGSRLRHWLLVEAESGRQLELETPDHVLLLAGDEVEARQTENAVVFSRVLKRSSKPLIGRFVAAGRHAYVVSESPELRARIGILPGQRHKAVDSDRVAVRVVGEDHRGLLGRIIEVVASARASDRASIGLLRAYQIPTDWSESVLKFAQRLPGKVQPGRHRERADLSGLPLVTIDGKDARDFDDAVYCHPNRRGGWRLLVAIADVSQYVQPGSPLETAAWERGNSVYLPDRMIPMLPEELSTGLCSLRPKEHRLALVCDMIISADGQIRRSRFHEAVIYSWARLTYSQVALFLDGKALEHDPEVHHSLVALHACYKALRGAREKRGALDFRTTEVQVLLDEDGNVETVAPLERNDANRMIEESMIAANVCAARFIGRNKRHSLYRVHGGPTGERLVSLRQSLQANGIRLSASEPKPKDLEQILSDLGDRKDRQLIETLILRSMTQASYSPHNEGHYGLALEQYTHFTSPIRRYADLLVHRTIRRILQGQGGDIAALEQLEDIGQHISATERRAESVSRDVVEWYKCEYASRWVGHHFQAQIMGVTDFGLFMELEGLHVQGLLHISNLGGDYYEFDPERMALLGRRSGRHFLLGDVLRVILADVDVDARKIDLLPLQQERRATRKNRRNRRL